MIVQCSNCNKYYDDQFRNTICPHDTFLANDGQNNFKHYGGAWLSNIMPQDDKYDKFLANNRIKV